MNSQKYENEVTTVDKKQSGKSCTIRESNQASDVREAHLALYILLAGTGVLKINSVACGFTPIKIHFSFYLKSLNSRIIEVYI